MLDVIPWSCR